MIGIIGAGLAGLTLAFMLLEQGVQGEEIMLWDKAQPGAGASGVPFAMMHPVHGGSLEPKSGYFEGYLLTQQWLTQLETLSQETLHHPLTLVRPARDAKVARRFGRSFERSQDFWAAHPYLKKVDNPHETYPLLQPCELAYVFEPAFIIDTAKVLATLQNHLKTQGVQCHWGVSPPVYHFEQGRWVVQCDTQNWSCKQLVIAVAEGFEDYFPNQLPMDYQRGETLVFESTAFENMSYGASAGGFLAPIGNKCITTGTTFYEGPPQDINLSIETILGKISGLIQLPKDLTLKRAWSGVRTVLRHDREPLVGPLPHENNLLLFTAFSTRGYLQIPRLAQQLAHYMLSGQREILEKYWAQRAFEAKNPVLNSET